MLNGSMKSEGVVWLNRKNPPALTAIKAIAARKMPVVLGKLLKLERIDLKFMLS